MLESEATTCTTIEGDDTKARFNIASCLAHSFKGLPDAVETCLHQASKTGNCSTVKNILQEKQYLGRHFEKSEKRLLKETFINRKNHLGATALWLAAAAGNVEVVNLLIKSSANLETEDVKGQTPLYAATKFNHVQCVKALLEAGANPEGSETNISTPIYIAARDNYPETMALLIQHGADVNGRHAKAVSTDSCKSYPGNLPVYLTVVYRHFECFKLLVKGGADLSIPLASSLSKSTLLQGILRYSCDVRFLRLLYFSGGVKRFYHVDELVKTYQSHSESMSTSRKECIAFLECIKRNPLSLSSSSRIAVRNHLGQKMLKNIDKLEVPTLLKDFLNLNFSEF